MKEEEIILKSVEETVGVVRQMKFQAAKNIVNFSSFGCIQSILQRLWVNSTKLQ